MLNCFAKIQRQIRLHPALITQNRSRHHNKMLFNLRNLRNLRPINQPLTVANTDILAPELRLGFDEVLHQADAVVVLQDCDCHAAGAE